MERDEIEQFALTAEEVFGNRPWTVHEALEQIPTEKMPAQVRRALERPGAFPSKSLGQLLSSSAFFVKRGTVHARKQLWLTVAQRPLP